MCGVAAIPIAALVIGAAGTGYTAYQQNKEAKAAQRFRSRMEEEGAKAAKQAFAASVEQENVRQSQEDEAAAQLIQQNQIRAAQAKSKLRVASAEAGVSGLSIDTLVDDFSRQQAIYDASVRQNRAYARQQYSAFVAGHRADLQRNILSVTQAPIRAPGYIGAGLQIGGQALGAYNDYRQSTQNAVNSTSLG